MDQDGGSAAAPGTGEVADTAVDATPKPAWYTEVNWDDPNQVARAMAEADENDFSTTRATAEDVLASHGLTEDADLNDILGETAEETPEDGVVETPPETGETETAEAAPTAAAAAPTIEALVEQLADLRRQVTEAKNNPEAAALDAPTDEQVQANIAERAQTLAEAIEDMGEDHSFVKALKVLHAQLDKNEKQLASVAQRDQRRETESAKAADDRFHEFQLSKNKVLGHITGGKPLDGNASPEAAWAVKLNEKYVPLLDAGKITREQLYEKVEQDLRKAFPALEKKLYTAAPSAPRTKAAAGGIESIGDLPGGASPELTKQKAVGITELNPVTMNQRDYDALFNEITR